MVFTLVNVGEDNQTAGNIPQMTLRFMSRGEIAEYLGVSLATVKGYANFPPPDVIVGRNQGWAKETIDAWAAKRRR